MSDPAFAPPSVLRVPGSAFAFGGGGGALLPSDDQKRTVLGLVVEGWSTSSLQAFPSPVPQMQCAFGVLFAPETPCPSSQQHILLPSLLLLQSQGQRRGSCHHPHSQVPPADGSLLALHSGLLADRGSCVQCGLCSGIAYRLGVLGSEPGVPLIHKLHPG